MENQSNHCLPYTVAGVLWTRSKSFTVLTLTLWYREFSGCRLITVVGDSNPQFTRCRKTKCIPIKWLHAAPLACYCLTVNVLASLLFRLTQRSQSSCFTEACQSSTNYVTFLLILIIITHASTVSFVFRRPQCLCRHIIHYFAEQYAELIESTRIFFLWNTWCSGISICSHMVWSCVSWWTVKQPTVK